MKTKFLLYWHKIKLKKFEKHNYSQRKRNKFISILIKLFVMLLMGLSIAWGANYCSVFLESALPESKEWTIALIALPLALLGIYISILLPTIKKYIIIPSWMSIEYKSKFSKPYFEYALSSCRMLLLFVSFLWILCYGIQDYSKMLAYTFVLTLDLVVLMCLEIRKYKMPVSKVYALYVKEEYKNNAKRVIQNMEILQKLDNNENIMGQLCDLQYKTYPKLFNLIEPVICCSINNKNNEFYQNVCTEIVDALIEIRFKKINYLFSMSILQLLLDTCNQAYEKQDYIYARVLFEKTFTYSLAVTALFLDEFKLYNKELDGVTKNNGECFAEFLESLNRTELEKVKGFTLDRRLYISTSSMIAITIFNQLKTFMERVDTNTYMKYMIIDKYTINDLKNVCVEIVSNCKEIYDMSECKKDKISTNK